MRESDVSTRILAIVLALFLWISVRMALKTPDIHRLVPNVPLSVGDSAIPGVQYQIPNSVDVELRGPAELLNNIPPLTATVNVANITDKHLLSVQVAGLPNGVTARAKKVEVTPIPVQPKVMPVTVIFLPALPKHTSVADVDVVPSDVTVEGSEKDLDLVKYVGVYIDPTSGQLGFPQDLTPQALNASGDPIKSVRILTPSVNVTISLQH